MDKSTINRLIWSFFAIMGFVGISFYLQAMAPVALGNAAALQLENSDDAYVNMVAMMHGYPTTGLSWLVLVIALVVIWFKPAWKKLIGAGSTLALLGLLISPAQAYYDTHDYPELFTISGNQSAFGIPLTGANADTQVQFGSIQYLEKAKVPTKQVSFPHKMINNPGWGTSNYYVPSMLLVIVDRSPYQRVWTPKGSGTNASTDEAMHADTSDGANITVAVTVGASVKEENAATFLYNFGYKSNATVQAASAANNDPAALQAAFASVAYGRSLADVMDTIVWAAVQAEFSNQFGKLSAGEIEVKKSDAIKLVEKNIKEMFAAKGITIEFLGLASGIDFDNPKVQAAMDAAVIAGFKAAESHTLLATIDYERQMAEIDSIKARNATMQKWDGHVTTPQVVSDSSFTSIIGAVKSFFVASSVTNAAISPK